MSPASFSLDGLRVHMAGKGPPLLLVHSINAAAGAHEMRPLVERFTATHSVYTPDLPGFGASARPDASASAKGILTSLGFSADPAIAPAQGVKLDAADYLSFSGTFLAGVTVGAVSVYEMGKLVRDMMR